MVNKLISDKNYKMLRNSKWWFFLKYLPLEKLDEALHAIRRPLDYRLREWNEFVKEYGEKDENI